MVFVELFCKTSTEMIFVYSICEFILFVSSICKVCLFLLNLCARQNFQRSQTVMFPLFDYYDETVCKNCKI